MGTVSRSITTIAKDADCAPPNARAERLRWFQRLRDAQIRKCSLEAVLQLAENSGRAVDVQVRKATLQRVCLTVITPIAKASAYASMLDGSGIGITGTGVVPSDSKNRN